MKKRILLILSLILGITTFAFAQAARTITNADLEKFRQAREQADADYRANYKQRGMPSPEEIERREARRERELADYAARARAAEQREYEIQLRANAMGTQNALIEAQAEYLREQNGGFYNQPVFVGGQVSTPFGYGGFYGGGNFYGNYPRNYGHRGYRQFAPLPPNVQIVRNAANSFPTAGEIRNQIYGIPPQIRGRRGTFGRRH
ncbi:MAG: hypothetical protein ACR2N3_02430 [Pyrinomonadaceae bacterium]